MRDGSIAGKDGHIYVSGPEGNITSNGRWESIMNGEAIQMQVDPARRGVPPLWAELGLGSMIGRFMVGSSTAVTKE